MSEGEGLNIEREQGRIPRLIDLTDGDKESYGVLKTEVEKSDGVVRVLVHPRFEHVNGENPMTEEYLEQLDGFMNVPDTLSSPLIVFEEEEAVSRLDDLLDQVPQAFLVRTIPADPIPATLAIKQVLPRLEELSEVEAFNIEKSAQRDLYGALKAAGIKRIVIGGRYFFLGEGRDNNYDFRSFITDTQDSPSNSTWSALQYYPKGCVGGVVRGGMEEGIEVVVSHATSPQRLPTLSDRHASLVTV